MRVRKIGSIPLWTGRIWLPAEVAPSDMQSKITALTKETGITLVGYLSDNPASLTLLRWPETREGYCKPSMPRCRLALGVLATRLKAGRYEEDIIPRGHIHTMMGRREGGYQGDTIVPLTAYERTDLEGYEVSAGHMVSARAIINKSVEEYGEPVGIIVTRPGNEHAIHRAANEHQQHHYVIEHAPVASRGHADLYETPWAQQDQVKHKQ